MGTPDLWYPLLLFGLFVVPKVLQRLRIPSAITSLTLGAATAWTLGILVDDPVVKMFATFGIVALFLFAGLEIDFDELRPHARVLAQHLALRLGALGAVAVVTHHVLGLELRASALVALALLTPSGGFILDALASLALTDQERFWIRSKVIATELVALGVMVVTLQSTTVARFSVSMVVLAALVAVLPLAFRIFAARIVPWAPKSEFAFLLMIAVVCSIVTRKLGAYYLVGAFVVGMTAQRFRERLPALGSEQMIHAVEVFASFFVPFYFFRAGLRLRLEDFGVDALLTGAVFLVLALPFRQALLAFHRRLAMGEPLRKSLRIGAAMTPTLVFTLVIAEILRDDFGVPRSIFGGLVVYTLVNTLIPGFALRVPTPGLEPHAPKLKTPALPRREPTAQQPLPPTA